MPVGDVLRGAADPHDPRWRDQHRHVGDGRGMPRITPGCSLVAAPALVAVVTALLILAGTVATL